MCNPDSKVSDATPRQASSAGSRRRRLWDLGNHAHCPVVGVCLPMAALRRLVDRLVDGCVLAEDYELHCGVVAECQRRSPVSEALQRELDRRSAVCLRQTAQAKTDEALAAWWQDASQGHDLGSALWAVLTHARCTAVLEQRVLAEVHMLQHQIGMACRIDLQRFGALVDENAVLARELGAAQQRATRLAAEHARRGEALQGELVRLRAQLVERDSLVAALREDLRTLEASVPALKSRVELAREGERLVEKVHQLECLLLQARQDAERQRRRADEAVAAPKSGTPATLPTVDAAAALARLHDRAVLCVGGRPASVPAYRRLVERTGGRFLHHDGGEEESASRLDATLAAADLVICQAGCISHDAYWRVKDHCKRTGKRCVFVETPSATGLRRALLALAPTVETEASSGTKMASATTAR